MLAWIGDHPGISLLIFFTAFAVIWQGAAMLLEGKKEGPRKRP